MTRFRKWLVTFAVALALVLPLASVASADPGDAGWPTLTSASTTRTTTAR